ncbi:MAG: thioredoxin [Actinomycetales bacterium]|nr:thioredoxin [Actinomycetales bacterium]
MPETKVVTDDTFEVDVIQADKPIVVDFWAPWCGPCRQVSAVLEEISAEYGDRIGVVMVNTDENPKVAAQYGIIGLPTVNVYDKGELVKSIRGAKPKMLMLRELADWID